MWASGLFFMSQIVLEILLYLSTTKSRHRKHNCEFWFSWHFVTSRPVIIIRGRRALERALVRFRFSGQGRQLLISGHSGNQLDKCQLVLITQCKQHKQRCSLLWFHDSSFSSKMKWIGTCFDETLSLLFPQVFPAIMDQCVSWSPFVFFKLACWRMVSTLSDN